MCNRQNAVYLLNVKPIPCTKISILVNSYNKNFGFKNAEMLSFSAHKEKALNSGYHLEMSHVLGHSMRSWNSSSTSLGMQRLQSYFGPPTGSLQHNPSLNIHKSPSFSRTCHPYSTEIVQDQLVLRLHLFPLAALSVVYCGYPQHVLLSAYESAASYCAGNITQSGI